MTFQDEYSFLSRKLHYAHTINASERSYDADLWLDPDRHNIPPTDRSAREKKLYKKVLFPGYLLFKKLSFIHLSYFAAVQHLMISGTSLLNWL